MGLQAGQRIGPYEIVSLLGAGGMGEVYRARDGRLGRDVAVKILPPALARNEERRRRFEQEAAAAGALSHPNVLVVHDIGDHEGAPYLVTELLEGETLRQRLARGPLSASKVSDLGVQIARGLAAAHDKGIVHRDIKPDNLFLTTDGRAKILDFGLAKLLHDEPAPPDDDSMPRTQPGLLLGTAPYMAPEQVRGFGADARSDLFSFGAVIYEMISGRRAFSGGTPVETMTAVLHEDPPRLSERAVPPGLEHVLRRCLEKSPADRFRSAHDLALALEMLSAHSDGQGVTPPTGILASANASRGVPSSSIETVASLAVLPLRNLSGRPEEEFFVDGMTEALITDLAKIRSLRIISRTSVMRYKNTEKTLAEIARELGVEAVVEGSVLRVGDEVRITAQLVDTRSDRHLWAESYDRAAQGVLAMQREVARDIAAQVKVTLTPKEQARLASGVEVDPAAHEAYLKGRHHWNRRTADGLQRAIALFQEALAADPGFALAHAGLAEVWCVIGVFSFAPPTEAYPRARAAADRALELDPELGEAHVARGWIRAFYDFDWAGAEGEFRAALELAPSYATAHQWYALYLLERGRYEEAAAEMRRAQSLDPLSLMIAATAGLGPHYQGRQEEAMGRFRRALELEPSFWPARWMLGRALEASGDSAAARAELEKAIELSAGNPQTIAALGHLCARSGDRAGAQSALDRLAAMARERYVAAFDFAVVYAGLDATDDALTWLERAYAERSIVSGGSLRTDPRLHPLRALKPYRDLLGRVGVDLTATSVSQLGS